MTPQAQRDLVAGMHPSTRPASVSATAFEPVPGQAAMQIFLEGKNGGETFYYRLLMVGTDTAGYKVAGIFRGNGPYPPSSLRQSL